MSLLKDPPFSSFPFHSIEEEHNRSLLLQFFLHELLEIPSYKQLDLDPVKLSARTIWYLPYDWGNDRGPLNKALEYASLLFHAFPKWKQPATKIVKTLHKLARSLSKKSSINQLLKEIYQLVETFFIDCEDDENLLFFLLKHQKQIDSFMGTGYLRSYLIGLYPKGLRSLEEMICDQYHERGFFSLIPELKRCIQALEND